MLAKISDFISTNQLLHPGGKYLVALSGGADSVALLLVLKELGYTLKAAHCNFRLRGNESDRDEAFCVSLCQELAIPLHRAHFDTRTYAALHHVSIEMAARELRYHYFEQLRQDLQLEGICVAHHSDDNVETIMQNLVRGTGVHGLTGMSPRNGSVLRPLLCVSRADIEHFLQERGQSFVTDSTNLVADVVRNKMRLNILPQLRELNPSFNDTLLRMASYLSDAEKVLDSVAEPFVSALKSTGFIELTDLLKTASPAYLLYQLLTPYGFSSSQLNEIRADLPMETGKMWQSKTHELLVDRGRLYVRPIGQTPLKEMKIPETGTYVYDETLRLKIEESLVDNSFSIPKARNIIALDTKKIQFPLLLRPCQVGDRFVPFGMNGSKLVSDYLTDLKKNLFEKRQQLVLVNGNDDLLWLVGERPDNRYRITDKTTTALTISMIRTEELKNHLAMR